MDLVEVHLVLIPMSPPSERKQTTCQRPSISPRSPHAHSPHPASSTIVVTPLSYLSLLNTTVTVTIHHPILISDQHQHPVNIRATARRRRSAPSRGHAEAAPRSRSAVIRVAGTARARGRRRPSRRQRVYACLCRPTRGAYMPTDAGVGPRAAALVLARCSPAETRGRGDPGPIGGGRALP